MDADYSEAVAYARVIAYIARAKYAQRCKESLHDVLDVLANHRVITDARALLAEIDQPKGD